MALEEVWNRLRQLMVDEFLGGYREDLCRRGLAIEIQLKARHWIAHTVQLFQSELLGFTEETEYHEPGDEVKASVESDCKMYVSAIAAIHCD